MIYPDDYINKVLHGDCLELMKQIPDGSVDLVLTDPPYLQDSHGGGGAFGCRMRDYHNKVDTLGAGFDNIILVEIVRICKKLNAYIFCSKNQLLQILTFFKDFNMDILTYHKTNPTPTCNNKYLSDTEYIIYVREKGVPLFGTYHTKRKYFIQVNGKSDYTHPTVKPLNIIKTLVSNSSKEKDLILDIFVGSGTTCVAAKALGRRFIGIDSEQKYVDIANRRLHNTVTEMFV